MLTRLKEYISSLRSNDLTSPLDSVYIPDKNITALTPKSLANLIENKSSRELSSCGGINGIAKMLNVNLKNGLDDSARQISHGRFGQNVLPKKPPVSFLKLAWAACNDKMLILLSISSLISLSIGIYQDIRDGTHTHWIEGAAILFAVVVVILVNSLNDYQRELQFRKLSEQHKDRCVNVKINGTKQQKSIFDTAVGDILFIDPGDVVPADCLLISGSGVIADESSLTGESDAVEKSVDDSNEKYDPFIISGSRILDGVGEMMVIAVGVHSVNGKLLISLQDEHGPTPLQIKLARLADSIAKTGAAIALLMLISLTVKYIVQLDLFNEPIPELPVIIENLLKILIETVTVVVVAVPEGLPMAVTLSLAYAVTRMLVDNNLVRVLAACETMGNATTICSDKTGTLTENKMTVVDGMICGVELPINESKLTNGQSLIQNLDLFAESVSINSTAFETLDEKTNILTFVGNKTETALLNYIMKLGYSYTSIRQNVPIAQAVPFSSERKMMYTITGDGRLHCKGAAEIIIDRCSYWIDQSGNVKTHDESTLRAHKSFITKLADLSLRTIAVAYKEDFKFEENQDPCQNMTLIAILGIEDPLRSGVKEAVAQCQKAGIFVRMVTGDSLKTAQSIASKCGILMRGGISMEGPRFRQLSDAALEEVIPKLQVLARSSPLDKQILVKKLRSMGEVVAVTGDGSNDGPALRAANVGFSMGITGTEVAKEASSIVLLDDNFTSIVKAVQWGRCVNDSIRKFLQFQLTVNCSAVVIAFVSAILDPQNQSILNVIQLLWINLIMDTFAALSLATDRPTGDLLERHPESQESSLITGKMAKVIISQATFQVIVILLLQKFGYLLFHLDSSADTLLKTIIFNTFVFMQLFNEINCRILHGELNPFKGILTNKYFVTIWISTLIAQILIVTFGYPIFKTTHLPSELWLVSIGIGLLSIPLALIVRLLPDWKSHSTQQRVFMSRERLHWQAAITDVKRNLAFFNAIRRAQKTSMDITAGTGGPNNYIH